MLLRPIKSRRFTSHHFDIGAPGSLETSTTQETQITSADASIWLTKCSPHPYTPEGLGSRSSQVTAQVDGYGYPKLDR
ncbi:hypothetical protein PT974_01193 [Cladobotryum mycophilum]|uniref:Uncharacterized protein n=1 Tax=Cladobotryum mycophilum TaxID=491253 RepID=A0ABR0T452_9HYPO